jgi:hypothetical protein
MDGRRNGGFALEKRRTDRSRRTIARRLSLAVILATLVGMIPGAAQAYTWSATGCTGRVDTPKNVAYENWGAGIVAFQARDVYRTDCVPSANERIRIIYRLYRFNGTGWTLDRSVWGNGGSAGVTVRPGYKYTFTGWSPSIATQTAYSLDMTVEWWNASGTSKLGSTYIDFNAISDYACGAPCHLWNHPTLGGGVMNCGPCWDSRWLVS